MSEQLMEVEALSAGSVALQSERHGEPAWLRAMRDRAWATYEALPFPDSNRDEAWRRTNVKRLARRMGGLRHAPQSSGKAALETLPDAVQAVLRDDEKRGGLLIRRDNGVVYHELDEEYSAQGVVFMDLADAIQAHPELVQQYLFSLQESNEGKFEAQHAAFANGGAFLYVPAGVVIDRPLQVIHWVDGSDLMLFPHTVVAVGKNGQATVMDEYLSENETGLVFVNSATELILAQGAALIYLQLQNWAENVHHLSFSRASTARDGNLNWTVGQFGGKLTRFQTEAEMVGQGGTALLNGVFFPTVGQQQGNYTLQRHEAPYCTSDLLFKGAIREEGRSVYEGGIKVEKGAQQTDAYQANRNLMLAKNAHADSIPSLEIEAHEVRCTHGSTTSQMDQEELFYLQSRGIPLDPATKLVVEGFFVPVLDRIPLRSVRDRLKESIQRKMAL
ncbi:MAG: Fe-S cluster assembly protein SufD [Ardenticatenales bacterium]|nr:Fe-S cluster assembly protein SufD [Ardenticatenales bacterium]